MFKKQSDLDIIKQLEKELWPFTFLFKKRLNQISLNNLWQKNGYTLDENSNIVGLNLDQLEIVNIPNTLFLLKNLQKLYLARNKIKTFTGSFEKFQHLNHLDLGFNQLGDISLLFVKLQNLNYLNLTMNNLQELPVSFGQLKNLSVLDLSKNQLKELPKSFEKLHKLNHLYLQNNQLQELPELFGQLKNLGRLDLRGNQLRKLPFSFKNLQNLNYLDLSKNQSLTLPESFGQLKNLKVLWLNENQLKILPAQFGQLKKLSELYLDNNQLQELPVSFGQLQNLNKLDLTNNPLEFPPPEIIIKGTRDVINYLRQSIEEGEQIYEAKILIIGEGEAGKTSLANKLINANYQLKEREPSTEGIDILQWRFKFEQDKTFRVNVWDFGGQEIYHATHQFFLTNRSLYVLVADTRKENTDFFYWLQIVELLADKSPVIIIKNEKDDRQCEIKQENELRGLFKNLQCTQATNLATNRGLKAIQTELKHQLQNLPHIGTKLPKTWADVRKTLENDERYYIDYKTFLTICDENGFKKRQDKDQLAQFLHDLGVCLHFKDDPLLKRTVILKPEWGTDAVYKVLDNQTVKNNQGQFTKQDLADIWQAEKYDDMHDELLQLMMNFKLCYKLAYRNIYIAPQLLSTKKPEYQLNTENNLLLRYAYKFMPKGMMTQFIVSIHKFIAEQQSLVWRDGVILDKDDTRAEIIEYYDNREITIQIQGKLPRELAYFITTEWDKIHDSYHNLKVQKLIPCNCSECRDQSQPYFHNYRTLLNLKSKSIQTRQCGESGEDVDINQLLGEVFKEGSGSSIQLNNTPTVVVENRIVNNAGNIENSNINQGNEVQQQLAQQLANLTPEQQAQMLEMFKNKK